MGKLVDVGNSKGMAIALYEAINNKREVSLDGIKRFDKSVVMPKYMDFIKSLI